MTRVLVLGGTGWLGHEIAQRWVHAGAEVVCLARGESGEVPDGARLVAADRTEPGAFASLDALRPAAGGRSAVRHEWDEVVELAYEPELVQPALTALADRAAHWTLVSTISVYAANDEPDADESADLVEPTDLSDYAHAKVAAERATAEKLGSRLLTVRPGLIVGPGDPSDRFGYWPARLARGGRMLAPTVEDRWVQVIDVADLAAWIVNAAGRGLTGTINATGHPVPMAEFLAATAEVTGFDGELEQAPDAWLLDHEVRYWAGPRSLPLWLPAEAVGFSRRSIDAFLSAGGTLRPLRETIERTLADEQRRGLDRPRRSGLSAAEEEQLLAELRSRE